jgi:hypothetical protein
MSNTTYNGWTNYATWRVNLEVFDGMDFEVFNLNQEPYHLGKDLKQWVEDYLSESTPEGLALDYALAFLSDVNWLEIAQHIQTDLSIVDHEGES